MQAGGDQEGASGDSNNLVFKDGGDDQCGWVTQEDCRPAGAEPHVPQGDPPHNQPVQFGQ